MKREMRHRVFIAWLLMVALLPVYVVKAFHTHHIGCEESVCKTTKTHHDCSHCYICQFVFSPFTEVSTFQCDIVSRYIIFIQEEKTENVAYRPFRVKSLRAPPIC